MNFFNKLTPIWITTIVLFYSSFTHLLGQTETILDRSFNSNITAYPFIYYTPETEFAFGAGGVYTFYAGKDAIINPSKLSFSGFYSTVKTYEFELDSELFFFENKYVAKVDLGYAHTVDRFYGIGYNTPDLGNEKYVMNSYGGILEFQMPPNIIIAKRVGLAYEYRDYEIANRGENIYLQDKTILGVDGGIISGLGMVYVWDTRDNIFYPLHGGVTKMSILFYSKDIGSDYTFSTFELDTRRYWSLDDDKVLAFQSNIHVSSEGTPFFKLPALGGSNIMRGYYQGRYRDNNFVAVQTEYRGHLWQKFGFVAFVSYGGVTEELVLLSFDKMRYAAGVGLRYLFSDDEKINLRADFAFGNGTNGIYFGIEEAF